VSLTLKSRSLWLTSVCALFGVSAYETELRFSAHMMPRRF